MWKNMRKETQQSYALIKKKWMAVLSLVLNAVF